MWDSQTHTYVGRWNGEIKQSTTQIWKEYTFYMYAVVNICVGSDFGGGLGNAIGDDVILVVIVVVAVEYDDDWEIKWLVSHK